VLDAEAEFLDAEHVGGGREVGQRHSVGDDVGGGGEARVEAAQEVEHQLRGRDGVADLPECSSSALQLLGVGVDGEVALGQVVELLLEDDGARLLVCLEQPLNGDVQRARVLIGLHGEVEDGVFGGVVHPASNTIIRLRPQGVVGTRSHRAIDVALQTVLPAQSGEEGLPLGEVGARQAQLDRDVLLDVDGGVGGEEAGGDSIAESAGGAGA
jgi:hypothetical protein